MSDLTLLTSWSIEINNFVVGISTKDEELDLPVLYWIP
jgi:hypothetical protein